jgi:GNAT superfamily N-acetyltransferase
MIWRAAAIGDDARVVEMSSRLFAEDPALEDVPVAHTRTTLLRLRAEPARGRAIVAEVEGGVVGYAFLISVWSNELGGEVCLVDELFVEDAYRGRGIAQALFAELARDAVRLRGVHPAALALEVSPKNARARALYERLGFRGYNTLLRRRL